MFTGLVQILATVEGVQPEPPGKRLRIRAEEIAAQAAVGDSVAVNGCCLTVVAATDGLLEFETGPETLARTNLGALQSGDKVNLERSLRVGDLLGGHFVTGHVDGLGTLAERRDEGEWCICWFSLPDELAAQLVPKGSVAVDGVSLTVVDAEADRFSVMLIPHTLAVTTLGLLPIGGAVNIETDLLGKYVLKALANPRAERR